MEELYIAIAQRLKDKVEGLALIDEDTGQLNETEDSYPVLFPCALIDASTIDWSNDRDFNQRGRVTITIKHAFDCYEDTQMLTATSLPYNKLKERLRQHKQLCSALHQYQFFRTMSPLMRVQSRHYTLNGRIKVYEVTFTCNIADNLDKK